MEKAFNFEYKFLNRLNGVSKGEFTSLNCKYDSGDNNEDIETNRNIVRSMFNGKNKLFFVNQVHGNKVFHLENENQLSLSDNVEADAVITDLKNVLIGVFAADCMPILIFEEKRGMIAAIHAGWRGAFANIISTTINALLENRCQTEYMNIFIGPCIQNNFDVNEDIYKLWIERNIEYDKYFIKNNDKYKFSLLQVVIDQIKEFEIDDKKLSVSNIDVSLDTDYFSYTRTKKDGKKLFGRNVSVIKLNL